MDFAIEPGSIPRAVLNTARRLLLDTVGCALAGHTVAKGQIATQAAELFGAGDVATIIGGGSGSLLGAAFANGELSNAIDMDAILTPGHVTPYVVAPLLAAAEAGASTGRQLLEAIALGHEISARVAGSFTPYREIVETQEGWSYSLSAVMGYGSAIVGSAVGAGVLFGLSRDSLLDCVGGAGYMAPVPSLGKYLRLQHSPMTKYTSPGWVSVGAVLAACLARHGYTGDRTVLDGDFGLWRMFGSDRCDWEFMLDGLGRTWHVLETEFKPYPSFRLGHAGIEAFIDLLADAQIHVDRINRIVVHADPLTASPIYLNRDNCSQSDAYLSWPHVIAAAALLPPGPSWQTEEALRDERIRGLREKVSVLAREVNPSGDVAAPGGLMTNPVTISVETDHDVYVADARQIAKGHPDRPMTDMELEDKFRTNASWRLPDRQVQLLLDLLSGIESADSLTDLLSSMRAQ